MADSEPLSVGVVRESEPGERRVALVPKLVERLVKRVSRVVVESGAGTGAMLDDTAFERAGARIGAAWSADIVVKVAPPTSAEVSRLPAGAVLIGFLRPLSDVDRIAELERAGVTAFAMESIPRITRAQAMDALSSQSGVAGYRSVLAAAERLPRFFPMLTTAPSTSTFAGGMVPAPPATTSAPRSPSRSARSARPGWTWASRPWARAATPVS